MHSGLEPVEGSLLALIPAEISSRLLVDAVRRVYDVGEPLMREDDPTDYVHVILSGWVRVSRTAVDGPEVLLALRGPGDVIGELAALLHSARSATVRAIERVEVAQIRGAVFTERVRALPDLGIGIIHSLANRLREAEAIRIDMATLDVSRRVAGYLVRLVRNHGVRAADGLGVALPITQQDIADHLGASLRHVTRSIAVLRQRGVVSTSRKQITVLRPGVLAGLAGSTPNVVDGP